MAVLGVVDSILTFSEASLLQAAYGRDDVVLWTCYKFPKDYPTKFVARPSLARRQLVFHGVVMADDIDGLRDMLPRGLTCLGKNPGDDKKIIEVWV
jgi:hypothetical protein